MRVLCEAGTEEGNRTVDYFLNKVRGEIALMASTMEGMDLLVFTAGIGENSVPVREAILSGLTWFGIEVDPEKNVFGVEGEISTPHSRVKVFVIPTDEELVIARDVEALKK